MNPRQRRGVLLLLVTLLGAVLTFVGISAYVSSISSQVGPMTQVLRLTADVQELHAVTADEVEVIEVPERWAPDHAVQSLGQLEGLVTGGAYASGTVLQTGMLEEPPGLQEGYREVSIMVDAETGVAGRIRSGDYVDIIATVEDPTTEERTAQVIVQNVVIINVGVATTVEGQTADGAFKENAAVPVTFALSTADSLKVAYAESFAVKLRLALRGTGDAGQITDPDSVYKDAGGTQSASEQAPNDATEAS